MCGLCIVATTKSLVQILYPVSKKLTLLAILYCLAVIPAEAGISPSVIPAEAGISPSVIPAEAGISSSLRGAVLPSLRGAVLSSLRGAVLPSLRGAEGDEAISPSDCFASLAMTGASPAMTFFVVSEGFG